MGEAWSAAHPLVAMVVGVNAAGKSVFSRGLAAALERSAYVEVDELRYKIVGGLVAHRQGVDPADAPQEYALQCDLACENALALARGFCAAGFSVVIDGIWEAYARRSKGLRRDIPGCEIVTVGVYCSADVLESRRAQRGWLNPLPAGTIEKLSWYRRNEGGFDFVVDTGRSDTAGHLDGLRGVFNGGLALRSESP